MTPFARALAASALAAASVGCAGVEAGPAASALAEGSIGVLEVERTEGVEGPAPSALSAAFARYRGLGADEVLGLVGHRLASPVAGCVFTGEGESAVRGEGEVELLDVGHIRVRVAGDEAVLSPRAFPDLASVMAGVFYAGDATLPALGGRADELVLAATGSADVPAFDATVPGPAALASLRVVSGDEALASALDRVHLSRDAGLVASWAAGDPDDRVELEVRSHGDVLRCAARDEGAIRVDADALAPLAPDADAVLVVRRVRITALDVAGIDDAFARIASTRVLAARLD